MELNHNESEHDHEIRKLLYGESMAAIKMKELKKDSWIKNVMRIYSIDRNEAELYFERIKPFQ
jgi:hypothetical protein